MMRQIQPKIWIPVIAAALIAVGLAIFLTWPREGKEPEIVTPEATPEAEVTPEIPADWKTYKNEEYGFKVRYPGNWEIEESSPDDPRTAAMLVSPNRMFCCPSPPPNVVISKPLPNPEQLPFEEWLKNYSPDAIWQLETLQTTQLPQGKIAYTVEAPGPGDRNLASYIEWGQGFLEVSFNDIDGDTIPFWQNALISFRAIEP